MEQSYQTVEEKTLATEKTEAVDHLKEVLAGVYKDDQGVTFEGDKYVVPKNVSLRDAIKYLHRCLEENDKEVGFRKEISYRYEDGLVALDKAIKRLYGRAELRNIPGFFGDTPPIMKYVDVGYNQAVEVPSGRFAILAPDSTDVIIQTGTSDGSDFVLAASLKKRNVPMVKLLWDEVCKTLRADSIYKGKAIDSDYNFMDMSGVDRSKIIFSDAVEAQINANILAPITRTEAVLDAGMPIKRGVLLEGPWGTGKTLTAHMTAQICQENDWTFISVKSEDKFAEAMEFAKRYEPAVVFVEDIDREAFADDDNEAINKILNTFDGIVSKTAKIIVVVTTNHVERIARGMLRPGRLDAVIHIGELDRNGVERLVRTYSVARNGESFLQDDVDFDAVYNACKGYVPAFLHEVVKKTMLYAISHNGTGPSNHLVSTQDLIHAATELRRQHELMSEVPETKQKAIDTNMRELVQETVEGELLIIKKHLDIE